MATELKGLWRNGEPSQVITLTNICTMRIKQPYLCTSFEYYNKFPTQISEFGTWVVPQKEKQAASAHLKLEKSTYVITPIGHNWCCLNEAESHERPTCIIGCSNVPVSKRQFTPCRGQKEKRQIQIINVPWKSNDFAKMTTYPIQKINILYKISWSLCQN